MAFMVRVLAALALSACAANGLPSLAPGSPAAVRLDGATAEQVAVRADEARSQAFAGLETARLTSTFGGRSLRELQNRVRQMRERGLKLQERDPRRAIVSWDAGVDEVVIQVEAEHRLVSGAQPDPPWSKTLRQWWARLGFDNGAWRVVNDRDLPPDQWRSVPT